MQKIKIQNRKEQKVAVIVEESPQANSLAFVMHGLGGFKEQPHIETIAQSFKEAGMTVVRFDTTNTLGESDGDYADATVTNYYQDLEDVIAWTKNQPWYREPFYLAGHSLGAVSVTLFSEKFSKKIKALVLTSIVLAGEFFDGVMEDWRQERYEVNGITLKEAGKPFEDDFQKYDVIPQIENLQMPILLIVGGQDDLLGHNKIFHEKLTTEKELHIIEGAQHTFRQPEHLAELKSILDNWLKRIA